MTKWRQMFRAAVTVVFALAMVLIWISVTSLSEFKAEESEGDESLREFTDNALSIQQDASTESLEGYIRVTVSEALQNLISMQTDGSDMSWIGSGQIDLRKVPNNSGGYDGLATFSFNGTELYHLYISYDSQEQVLYVLCPELKDQAFSISIRDMEALLMDYFDPSSSELMQQYSSIGEEAISFFESVPSQTWQQELDTYIQAIAKYITASTGTNTTEISAGTLTGQSDTVTFSISSDQMQELIPELLTLLSEDKFLEQVFNSDFVNDLIQIYQQQYEDTDIVSGSELYEQVSNYLSLAAIAGDFSDVYGIYGTYGTYNSVPNFFSLALEKDGVLSDIFAVSCVTDGAEYALEFDVGAALALAIGIDSSTPNGLSIQGEAAGDLVDGSVSLVSEGYSMEVFRFEDLDIAKLLEGKLSGTFVIPYEEKEYSVKFSEGAEGGCLIEIMVDGDLYLAIETDLTVVAYTESDEIDEIDEIDKASAFVVTSEEDLEEYIRNAHIIDMFSQLANAGVPSDLVDQLTSNESVTESSKENIEDGE